MTYQILCYSYHVCKFKIIFTPSEMGIPVIYSFFFKLSNTCFEQC